MKKSRLAIILLLSVLVILVVVYVYNLDESTSSSVKFTDGTNVTHLNIEVTDFVPVTYFTNTLSNISLTELKSKELITYSENMELIPEEYLVTAVEKEELVNELETGKIALLTPPQVEAKVKTLAVDGNYYWSKQKNYPLVKYELVIGEQSEPELSEYKFFAGGEIIPARAVDRLGLNKYNNYTYLFDYFREDIEDADISIALLENAIMGNPSPCTGCMSFQGDEQVAAGLAEVGFDFLSTAGNHAGDAGQAAYASTLELLRENNIQVTGSGDTDEAVIIPLIQEINGQTIGMLSADDVAFYYWKKLSDDGVYGTNWFSKYGSGGHSIDQERVNLIGTIKTENKIDYLIVYMSWGVEYTNYPTSHQQELAKAILDAGADIIIGSHPHWVQSIEFYDEKPIIYSLGNFIFDQTHTTPTRQGAAINLHYLNNQLKEIEIMPHQICGYHQTGNDLSSKLINGEMTLDEIYDYPESSGCVYWQPKKLDYDHPAYNDVLERVYEFTEIQ